MHGILHHAPTGRGRTALRRLRARVRRLPRWWPVPLCALLGTAGGGAYQAVEPPRYAATGRVVVVPGKGTDPAAALGLAQSYGRLATSGAVLTDAHRDSGLPLGALRDGIRAATSPDAPTIEVTGTARTPAAAAGLADAVTRSLAGTGNRTALRTGAHLLVLARAAAPDGPVPPSAPLSAAVGGAAGGLLGGLVLLVRPRERPPAVRAGGSVPAPAHTAVEAGAVPAAEGAVR
ncbi:lipopolysaccharide biosynthesis protein [Streptomyces sp. NPDC059649]|uniref:lipopolysaccharide biosynthesis protein n=1 Tax=Streptomyces sp. NPDC059649 TaxID=3346895 RepID=UPI00367AA956